MTPRYALFAGRDEDLAYCSDCGSSADWAVCDDCEDGWSYHDCGEDCCACLHPEPNVRCDICGGNGGWWLCLGGHTLRRNLTGALVGVSPTEGPDDE